MVNDYFSQAAIDFFLGNVSALVFEEFEADMMTKDPAVSVTRMRELAIEQCQRRVVADDAEDFTGGWVLLAPHSVHLIRSRPLVEVVLLLTDAALYVCQFDWNTDKVSSFERIALANVVKIRHGPFVTSPLSPTQVDEARNVGLVVEYMSGQSVVRRRNTRTMDTLLGDADDDDDDDDDDDRDVPPSRSRTGLQKSLAGLVARRQRGTNNITAATATAGEPQPQPQPQRVALKAPYAKSSMVSATTALQTEAQLVASICSEIDRLAGRWRLADGSSGTVLEQGAIISADEARRNTGLLGQLGHSIKRMVWAS